MCKQGINYTYVRISLIDGNYSVEIIELRDGDAWKGGRLTLLQKLICRFRESSVATRCFLISSSTSRLASFANRRFGSHAKQRGNGGPIDQIERPDGTRGNAITGETKQAIVQLTVM